VFKQKELDDSKDCHESFDLGNQRSDSEDSNQNSDMDERKEEERCFEKFMLIRSQYFMSKMSEHVHLIRVIKFLEDSGHGLKFDHFKRTFEDKIQTETYFVQILETGSRLVAREVLSH